MTHAVLVVGGSGYLGQFLVKTLEQKCTVGATVSKSRASETQSKLPTSVQVFPVDFVSGEGLAECLSTLKPDVVVNCVAISQPGVCEKDPNLADSVNIPRLLVQKCKEIVPSALFVHVSTDQVFDGEKAMCSEDDKEHLKPVNVYGRTKLAGEEYVRKEWEKHIVIRPSIIYGPLPPYFQVPRKLFVQWMDEAIRGPEKTTFFHDEFRCPVFVDDICSAVEKFVERGDSHSGKTFNFGGPDRLSRVDMANVMAEVRGVGKDYIAEIDSASVDRGLKSPPDISMQSKLIEAALGRSLTTFKDGLTSVFKGN